METKKNNKIESLQVLRAIAFLGIFTSTGHTDITKLGGWGVSIFFVLSGFLMLLSYYDRDGMDNVNGVHFAIDKIAGIYPLHIAMLLLNYVIQIVVNLGQPGKIIDIINNYWVKFVVDASLMQAWIPDKSYYYSINSVSWYLSVCLFLYAVFPFFLKLMKKYKGNYNAVISIAVILIIQIAAALVSKNITIFDAISDDFGRWFVYVFPVYRLGDFLIGCNVAYIFKNMKKEEVKKTTSQTVIFSFFVIRAVLLTVFCQYMRERGGFVIFDKGLSNNVIYIPVSVAFIILFVMKKGIFTTILTNKFLVWFGDISKYTFLIQIKAIKLVKIGFEYLGMSDINKYILTIAALALTILMAEIYIFFEKKVKEINKRKRQTNSVF